MDNFIRIIIEISSYKIFNFVFISKNFIKSIIGSMLVKSMIHGRDPNWGRLMMALGKSGIQIIENNVDIYLNDIHIAHEGKSVRFSKESVITSMNAKEIKIKIDLNIDNYESTAWGCDLTEEYVVFNSAYST